MKRVELNILRCINKKCSYRIITNNDVKDCPICKTNLKKDNGYKVHGLEGTGDDEAFIMFKKKSYYRKKKN